MKLDTRGTSWRQSARNVFILHQDVCTKPPFYTCTFHKYSPVQHHAQHVYACLMDAHRDLLPRSRAYSHTSGRINILIHRGEPQSYLAVA